jgi:erythromycin esterase-like protein
MVEHEEIVRAVDEHAIRLAGEERDFGPILDRIGDAHVVLVGEATHGTHEFYRFRAELTKRLIEREGFRLVAAEADWPDAYRVNRWVQHQSGDESAREALGSFERFPQWMWRNTEVLEFVEWLRAFNAELESDRRAGFYGLDVYSMRRSARRVVEYLEEVDPAAADRARERYACFDHAGAEPRQYGLAAVRGLADTCEGEVIEQLVELREKAGEYLERDGLVAREQQFVAEQDALVAKNAEAYYRSMFERGEHSWNVRDRHMAQTLERLLEHYISVRAPAKAVVWAHNSHLGDCRATDMSARGEINLGQLVRKRFGDEESVLVGMTSYDGTVSAASNWDAPVDRKTVRPAREDSFEGLFHQVPDPYFVLPLEDTDLTSRLDDRRYERAIGVIYRPETELASHYFKARLASQFDMVVHLDRTRALEPLEISEPWHAGEELPETYPSGL